MYPVPVHRSRFFSRSVTSPRTPTGSLETQDERLLAVLDRDFRSAAERAGSWLVCKPGCSQCCYGPFPVTALDSHRLRRGLARTDPATREEILRRARDAVAALSEGYPGDRANGKLVGDPDLLDRFFERHASLPCPALDTSTGRCQLYEWRPVSCRTYGPPLRFSDEKAPHCRLCFDGASPETVERCRVEPDREGLEGAMLADIGQGGESWGTLIAFALVREP